MVLPVVGSRISNLESTVHLLYCPDGEAIGLVWLSRTRARAHLDSHVLIGPAAGAHRVFPDPDDPGICPLPLDFFSTADTDPAFGLACPRVCPSFSHHGSRCSALSKRRCLSISVGCQSGFAGISPYAYPPEAPDLEKFRDDRIYPMINSKPYITAYPPISQLLFRLSFTLFGANVIAMKAIFSLFEFLALLVAWRLLVAWKQSVQPLLLMAWHPFFIFEFSNSGHSDSVMMFLALLSIYLLSRRRSVWGMISYAGAVLAKLHPALWFPLYLRRTGWKPAIAGLIAGLGLVLLYFDSIGSWLRYMQSLKLYFRLFEFNASIHYLIRFIGRVGFDASWDKVIGPCLGAVLLLITVLIVWKFPVRDARASCMRDFGL